MRFARTARRPPAIVDLTALLDVVFLLLLFFVVSSSFERARSLDVQLPEVREGQGGAPSPQLRVLSLRVDGQLSLDGEVLSLDALAERLSEGERIRLEADEAVTHGEVVKVMDVLQSLKLEALRIGVKEAKAPARGASP